MCGIVGYIGDKKTLPILIKGLKRLEYRGYDSAGIAYEKKNKIYLEKEVGRIQNLEKKLNLEEESYIGIGHTRWATHGKVTKTNSHPHQVNKVTLVHNGIIENYQELKKELIEKGYHLKTETDSEVACAYIDYTLRENKNLEIEKALNLASHKLVGSYAFLIMIEGIENKLFALKKESPLVIGIGKGENFIASDFSAYLDNTKEYIILEDNEVAIIEKNKVTLYKDGLEIPYQTKTLTEEVELPNLENNEHYMLKEIKEQSSLIQKCNQLYLE